MVLAELEYGAAKIGLRPPPINRIDALARQRRRPNPSALEDSLPSTVASVQFLERRGEIIGTIRHPHRRPSPPPRCDHCHAQPPRILPRPRPQSRRLAIRLAAPAAHPPWPNPLPPPAPSLTGVLERIIFHNEENHYTIAEFRPDTALPAVARAHKNPGTSPAPSSEKIEKVTIVGALPSVECGETLHLTGEWTQHSQHGAQFKIAAFKSELPASVYGIRKYLGSGLVPGIGKAYAN